MTTKTVNYTAEQTAELVAAYVATPTAETVQAFAVKLGKNAKSIVAKLVREGVYMKKEYISKTGAKPIAKDSLADQIGMLLGLSENDTASLAKANKNALQKVLDSVKADKLKGENDVA